MVWGQLSQLLDSQSSGLTSQTHGHSMGIHAVTR